MPAKAKKDRLAGSAGPAFTELERSVECALEHYSNVHRGTGHNSIASTVLFEASRTIILDHLGLNRRTHVVIFCTPRRLELLRQAIRPGTRTHVVSSLDLGLPLGLRAVAVPRRALRCGPPPEPGGGTIRMVSPDTIAWADVPDRFEPGTPNIIGVVALARALQLTREYGPEALRRARGARIAPEELFRDDLPDAGGTELLGALRAQLIGRSLQVPVAGGTTSYINFDNGASTPTFRPIWDVFRRAWRQPEEDRPGIIEAARRRCADFFGAPPHGYDIIFTSNTTEAVNVACRCLDAVCGDGAGLVLNTLIEHNSNELPWRLCSGRPLLRLQVDDAGFIDLELLERTLREHNRESAPPGRRIGLVAVCGASNVTGTCNDITAVTRIAHHHGARVLIDAAQLAAHRPIRVEPDGIDFLAFSAHKMYAPFGSGGLIARRELLDRCRSELDDARRSGEENVAGVAALGKAVELLGRIGLPTIAEEERRLTEQVLRGLRDVAGVRVYGISDPADPRLSRRGGVICFSLPHIPHNLAAHRLAEAGGIGVRNGCFCVNMFVKRWLGIGRAADLFAHAGLRLAPRLMGQLLVGLVRVSFGLENTPQEVEHLLMTVRSLMADRVAPPNRLLARLNFGTPFMPRTRTGRRVEAEATALLSRVYGADEPRLRPPPRRG